MGLLKSIGNWLWNGAKGTASSFGFDTSSFENDEAQKFQAQQSQMNRDWQEKMLDKQMAYQTDMWNKSNQYNSASAVMQRYREAGLNPYMMMSGGNAGFGASSPSSPSSPSAPSPSGGFAGTHPTPAGQFIKNIADAKAALSDKRLKDADSTLKEIEARTHGAQLIANLEKTRLTNQEQKYINDYKQEFLDSTAKLIKAQEFKLNSEAHLNIMDSVYRAIEIEHLPPQLKANIANTIANTRLTNNMNITEGYKQGQMLQDIIESCAREENIRLTNQQIRKTANAIYKSLESDAYWSGWKNFGQGLGNIGTGIGSIGSVGKSPKSYHSHGGHYTTIYNK